MKRLQIDETLDYPRYAGSLDFAQLERDYPPPPEFFRSVYRMPRPQLDALREQRFLVERVAAEIGNQGLEDEIARRVG